MTIMETKRIPANLNCTITILMNEKYQIHYLNKNLTLRNEENR